MITKNSFIDKNCPHSSQGFKTSLLAILILQATGSQGQDRSAVTVASRPKTPGGLPSNLYSYFSGSPP
ncbi:hypothetical protein J6590_047559 [Homalodisca vitripennis]|nr:hypothetical protein J6590_047559 [Homalodisca vitripennis]